MAGYNKTDELGLLKRLHSDGEQLTGSDRRGFLKNAMAMMGGAAGVALAPSVLASNNLPPNVPSWTRSLGTGLPPLGANLAWSNIRYRVSLEMT